MWDHNARQRLMRLLSVQYSQYQVSNYYYYVNYWCEVKDDMDVEDYECY